MHDKERKISSYILRNQQVAIAYRNGYFQKACEELDTAIEAFSEHEEKINWEQFAEKIENLLFYLEEARFYGRWSVGWDVASAYGHIDIREISAADHIEMFYSHVRSIRRLIRHENAVIQFHKNLGTEDTALKTYANKVIADDESNVLTLLKSLGSRVQLFGEAFSQIHNKIEKIDEHIHLIVI
ncbi:MAG: hypothetical protein B6244_00030 [Candidatus Cloacimonetes bacterium 4572_55]|nr:MAG: hypothetical protein B6244_00030 [Candidatus Cloacimonetes bacterium 4572_55]